MKLVINRCYGGFSVSLAAAKHMAKAGSARAKKVVDEHKAEIKAFKLYRDKGILTPGEERDVSFRKSIWDICIKYAKLPNFHGYGHVDGFDGGFERADPLLVSAVEQLGEKASGELANLAVVEIPDSIEWELDEYDGIEHVAEKHRTWA